MSRENAYLEPAFGYISTLESPEHGFFGGYLLLSPLGHPLEFHCTSPVRPSAAQQILYGPTLQPYLLGEQICGALLRAAKLSPQIILTDVAAVLTARIKSSAPMALVLAKLEESHTTTTLDMKLGTAASTANFPGGTRDGQLYVGGYELALPAGFDEERHLILSLMDQLTQHVEIAEPFGRIHEAIREAQRIGTRSTESHGQAA